MSANGGATLGRGASTPFTVLPAAEAAAATAGQFDCEEETTHKVVGDVTLLVGPSPSGDEGLGNLLVTTKRLIWVSSGDPSKAYCVGYRAIIVHAVSRDLQSFDRPCIYVQLDEDYTSLDDDHEEDEERSVDGVVTELRLAPADPSQLEQMFESMSECAAMNPDSDVEDDEGDFFYNEDEVMAGADPEQREAMLAHYDSILRGPDEEELDELVGDDPERFADADEL